jgi:hypothetical protein
LKNVYTKAVWVPAPDHHLVFSFQSMPRNSTGRKRMKYLSEGGLFGDTGFNSWPVPEVPVANLPKTTQKLHDDIFEKDTAEDSGDEDGTGSAVVQDLGDKVIPFPRELSEMLTREMIHVFDIQVGVFLTPASGKSLMAVILENRRAVAIVKNKDHKEFIMQQLMDSVKFLNLAADTRPAKPHELTTWELAGGAAKAGGAAPQAPGAPVLGGTPTAAGAGGAAAGASPMIPPPMPPRFGTPVLPPPCNPAAPGAPPPPAAAGLAAFGAQTLR